MVGFMELISGLGLYMVLVVAESCELEMRKGEAFCLVGWLKLRGGLEWLSLCIKSFSVVMIFFIKY